MEVVRCDACQSRYVQCNRKGSTHMLFTHMLIEQGPVVPTARPAQVIFVGEDYNTRFNAVHGDTIIVVMKPAGDVVARCNDMGGEPVYNPFTLINTCEGVDF